jgi:HK97 gp10 family phage protein
MDRVAFKLDGAEQVKAKLVDLSEKTEQKMKEAVGEAGLNIQRNAKLVCPVDTGTMRNSIMVDFQGLTATVHTYIPYAPYVEFGTFRMRAQPYLTPAAKQEEPRFLQRLIRILKEEE